MRLLATFGRVSEPLRYFLGIWRLPSDLLTSVPLNLHGSPRGNHHLSYGNYRQGSPYLQTRRGRAAPDVCGLFEGGGSLLMC